MTKDEYIHKMGSFTDLKAFMREQTRNTHMGLKIGNVFKDINDLLGWSYMTIHDNNLFKED